jgi:hypothetical protein
MGQAIRPIFVKALFKGEFLVHGFFLRLSELEINKAAFRSPDKECSNH